MHLRSLHFLWTTQLLSVMLPHPATTSFCIWRRWPCDVTPYTNLRGCRPEKGRKGERGSRNAERQVWNPEKRTFGKAGNVAHARTYSSVAESSPHPQDAGFAVTAGKSPSLSNDEEGLGTYAGSPARSHRQGTQPEHMLFAKLQGNTQFNIFHHIFVAKKFQKPSCHAI